MFSKQALWGALIFGVYSSSPAAAIAASGIPADEDVAIHPVSGETFILERGSGGRALTWLNDHDLSFEKRVPLEDQGASEIELLKDGTLVVLSSQGEFWSLRRFRPLRAEGDASLRAVTRFAEVSGTGRVGGLSALPDGRVVLARAEKSGESSVLLIGARTQESPSFEILETISGEKFASASADARGSSESSDLIASGEGSGVEEPRARDAATTPGMGFSAGALSGIGIAYRRHFANRWGIHVSGIAYGDASMVWANAGVNFMRTMSLTAKTRFYVITGVSAFYSGSEQTSYLEPKTCPVEEPYCDPYADAPTDWVNTVTLNFGAGIGMEFLLTKNLGLAIELPITVMLGISDSPYDSGVHLTGIYPIPSAALIYYF